MAVSRHQKSKCVPGAALNKYTSWKLFYFSNHKFLHFSILSFDQSKKIGTKCTHMQVKTKVQKCVCLG
jgi:hypothetical protein